MDNGAFVGKININGGDFSIFQPRLLHPFSNSGSAAGGHQIFYLADLEVSKTWLEFAVEFPVVFLCVGFIMSYPHVCNES
jgi:hypothetical protein